MKKEVQPTQRQPKGKKPYASPKLVEHGDVRQLTKSGTASGNEGPGVGNAVRRL